MRKVGVDGQGTKKEVKDDPCTIRSLQEDVRTLREEVDDLIETRSDLRSKLEDSRRKVAFYEYQLAIIRAALKAAWAS